MCFKLFFSSFKIPARVTEMTNITDNTTDLSSWEETASRSIPTGKKTKEEIKKSKVHGRQRRLWGYWGVGFMNTDWAVTGFTYSCKCHHFLASGWAKDLTPSSMNSTPTPPRPWKGKKFPATHWGWANCVPNIHNFPWGTEQEKNSNRYQTPELDLLIICDSCMNSLMLDIMITFSL